MEPVSDARRADPPRARSGEPLRARGYGEHGVLVELPAHLRPAAVLAGLDEVGGATTAIDDVILGASTILLQGPGLTIDRAMRLVRAAITRATTANRTDPTTHEIPVVYDGADLADVAVELRMSPSELVTAHQGATYTVEFLGFVAGFPYLSGLDPALSLGRLATPRSAVPAGSVAVAGGWCGIYPISLPGGWRLLGRTTSVIFDAGSEQPNLLEPGDLVRFVHAG
jgi:KipI family sensor histidine kinase inhibitor